MEAYQLKVVTSHVALQNCSKFTVAAWNILVLNIITQPILILI